ncbi:MAG: PepSY-like domain-containing protein [Dysgonomonas sp.]
MKKIILLFSLIFITVNIYSSDIPESAVPAGVKSYITKHYPAAKNIEWEYKNKKDYYEAEFYLDGREIKLEIDSSGKLLYSKEDMFIKDIPAFATSYIKKNYPNTEILGANKRVKDGQTSYSVGVAILNKKGRYETPKHCVRQHRKCT